jgi:hypothetical protein
MAHSSPTIRVVVDPVEERIDGDAGASVEESPGGNKVPNASRIAGAPCIVPVGAEREGALDCGGESPRASTSCWSRGAGASDEDFVTEGGTVAEGKEDGRA